MIDIPRNVKNSLLLALYLDYQNKKPAYERVDIPENIKETLLTIESEWIQRLGSEIKTSLSQDMEPIKTNINQLKNEIRGQMDMNLKLTNDVFYNQHMELKSQVDTLVSTVTAKQQDLDQKVRSDLNLIIESNNKSTNEALMEMKSSMENLKAQQKTDIKTLTDDIRGQMDMYLKLQNGVLDNQNMELKSQIDTLLSTVTAKQQELDQRVRSDFNLIMEANNKSTNEALEKLQVDSVDIKEFNEVKKELDSKIETLKDQINLNSGDIKQLDENIKQVDDNIKTIDTKKLDIEKFNVLTENMMAYVNKQSPSTDRLDTIEKSLDAMVTTETLKTKLDEYTGELGEKLRKAGTVTTSMLFDTDIIETIIKQKEILSKFAETIQNKSASQANIDPNAINLTIEPTLKKLEAKIKELEEVINTFLVANNNK